MLLKSNRCILTPWTQKLRCGSNRAPMLDKKSAELIVLIEDAISIAPSRSGRSKLKLLPFHQIMYLDSLMVRVRSLFVSTNRKRPVAVLKSVQSSQLNSGQMTALSWKGLWSPLGVVKSTTVHMSGTDGLRTQNIESPATNYWSNTLFHFLIKILCKRRRLKLIAFFVR